MHHNYFVKSIFPNIPNQILCSKVPGHPEPVIMNNIVHAPIAPAINIEQKPVMVIVDPINSSDSNSTGMTNDSFQLLEKIMLSLHITKEHIHYLKTWDLHLTFDELLKNLHESQTKIVFLIGSVATQHFLGKDKKISQVQGQILDYSHQDKTYYFICLYHPDFIALNSSIKSITWNSIKTIQPWIKQQLALD